MRYTLPSLTLTAALLVMGLPEAGAVATSCDNFSPDVTNNVTGTSACQIDQAIDNDSPDAQFLDGDWFGFDDWSQDAKDNDLDGVDEGLNTLDFSVSGNRLLGDWMFGNSLAGLDVMLVFKDGQNANPNGLVSYLVNESSGTYLSMFFNEQRESQQISHVSVWVRESEDPVPPGQIPLPATAWLMLIGLAGILPGIGRRMRA